ncbi:helix-turn-helix domain-containing protein [Rhizobium leguminosarum]
MSLSLNTSNADLSRLALIRRDLGVTQAEFASAMGVPFRTFQDLEAGKSAFRMIHLRAAERAAMEIAARTNQTEKLPAHLKELIKDIAKSL